MASVRLYDIFNCKLGATQVLGAQEFEGGEDYVVLSANTDGLPGMAARDRGPYSAMARLTCQDIEQWADLVALWEASDSISVEAAGKKAGTPIGTSYAKATASRMKLAAASFAITQGNYGRATFDMLNSAAAASDSPDDEIAVVDVASGSVTHANKRRAVRVVGMSFDPNGAAGAIVAENLKALSVNLRLQTARDYGDDDWGQVAETGGYELTGSIEFGDVQLSSTQTIGQALLAADWGALTVDYQQQGYGTGANLMQIAIQNCFFDSQRTRFLSRQFGRNVMAFGAFFQNGADAYNFSGANQILTIAAA